MMIRAGRHPLQMLQKSRLVMQGLKVAARRRAQGYQTKNRDKRAGFLSTYVGSPLRM